MDVIRSTAILHSSFNSTFSTKFCGAKAVDYQCQLSATHVRPCATFAMAAADLELALHSYDQLFRRLLKFKHDSAIDGQSKQVLTVTVLLDAGTDANTDGSVELYVNKIKGFLQQLWAEQYDKVLNFPALHVHVALVLQ